VIAHADTTTQGERERERGHAIARDGLLPTAKPGNATLSVEEELPGIPWSATQTGIIVKLGYHISVLTCYALFRKRLPSLPRDHRGPLARSHRCLPWEHRCQHDYLALCR